MITTVTGHVCPKCGSDHIAKNEKDPRNSKKKYYCMSCKKYGTLIPASRYSEEQKATALRVDQERASLRGVERALGIARHTVAGWLKKRSTPSPRCRRAWCPGNQEMSWKSMNSGPSSVSKPSSSGSGLSYVGAVGKS